MMGMSDPQATIQAIYDRMSESPASEHERILRESMPGLSATLEIIQAFEEFAGDVANELTRVLNRFPVDGIGWEDADYIQSKCQDLIDAAVTVTWSFAAPDDESDL